MTATHPIQVAVTEGALPADTISDDGQNTYGKSPTANPLGFHWTKPGRDV